MKNNLYSKSFLILIILIIDVCTDSPNLTKEQEELIQKQKRLKNNLKQTRSNLNSQNDQMLGKPVTLEDVECFDPDLYKNLLWTNQNDVTGLDLTFTWYDEEEHELIEGGKEIEVNEANKEDYIKEVVKWKYVTSVKNQMDAFLRGFSEIIPLHLLSIFNEKELELALCGSPKIDVDSWKSSTTYENSDDINSKPVQWFWEVVRDFDDNMKSRLLQFVTGSPRVPVGGLTDLEDPFTIYVVGSPNNLPVAHTCINMLDLPPYESKNQLKEKLEKAITETEGFHVV